MCTVIMMNTVIINSSHVIIHSNTIIMHKLIWAVNYTKINNLDHFSFFHEIYIFFM